jgi:sialidase-1
MKFSDDTGNTWSSIHTVHVEQGHTIGNPAPVADLKTGAVHLLFSRDNNEVYTMQSEDNGETWTVPVNQTSKLKPTMQHDLWVATGPGGGIQLTSGRLIAPAYYNPPNGKTASYAIFSDDHGKSWQRGVDVGYGDAKSLGENQLAVLPDGRLAMTIRAEPASATFGYAQHAIAISADDGQTWEIPARMLDIRGPPCQGSIVSSEGGLFFAAPLGSTSVREDMAVYDLDQYGGRPGFPPFRVFWKGPAAYSSMIQAGSASPGFLILFERGFRSSSERLTFASSVQTTDSASSAESFSLVV